MDKQILKDNKNSYEIESFERHDVLMGSREINKNFNPRALSEEKEKRDPIRNLDPVELAFMNQALESRGLKSESEEVSRALYLVGVEEEGTHELLKTESFKAKLIKIKDDKSIKEQSEKIRKIKLALATRDEMQKELKRVDKMLSNVDVKSQEYHLWIGYKMRLESQLAQIQARESVLHDVKAKDVIKKGEDEETQKAWACLVKLVDKLDKRFADLIGQINEKSDSTLFKNMCARIIEFRSLAKSKDFDPAKESTYVKELCSLRVAVASYYNKNKGIKGTSKGRTRRDLSSDILKSIDECVLEAPEYLQNAFGFEMESSKECADTLTFDSTKELYRNLAANRFKEVHNGLSEEEIKKNYVNSDTFRIMSISKRTADISNAVTDIFEKNKIAPTSDLSNEMDRLKGFFFGKILKNHDGSYTEDSINNVKRLEDALKKDVKENPDAFNGYFFDYFKSVVNMRLELKDFLPENLNKNLVKFRDTALQIGQIQNVFFGSKKNLGSRYFDRMPQVMKDRLEAVYNANIFDYSMGEIFNRFNILPENGNPKSSLLPCIFDLSKLRGIVKFIQENPTLEGLNISDEWSDLEKPTRYFDEKEKSVKNTVEFNLQEAVREILQPGERQQRYTKAITKLNKNPRVDFESMDSPLSYMKQKYKNERLSTDSLYILSSLKKWKGYMEYLKMKKEYAKYNHSDNDITAKAYDRFSKPEMEFVQKLFKPVGMNFEGKIDDEYGDSVGAVEYNEDIIKAFYNTDDSSFIKQSNIVTCLVNEVKYFRDNYDIFKPENIIKNLPLILRAQSVARIVEDNYLWDNYFIDEEKNQIKFQANLIENRINQLNEYVRAKYGVDIIKQELLENCEVLKSEEIPSYNLESDTEI